MKNKSLLYKEVRALERTLHIIRKCINITYLLCTPYRNKEFILNEWCQLIKKLWFFKGSKFAVKQLKEYNRVVKLSFQYNVIPQELRMKWTKCDSRGIPKDISFLKPWITSDSLKDKRFALDVLNTYRLIFLPPDKDTTSITRNHVFSTSQWPGWKSFLTFWVKKFPIPNLGWKENSLGWGTTKAGPNGPSLIASHIDSVAVWENPELSSHYKRWLDLTNQSQLETHSKNVLDKEASLLLKRDLKSSKLSFLSEGGGKTRVIAIADYWTQLSLLNLHKACMKNLKALSVTDATYDHSRVTTKLIDETKQGNSKPLYSLDLSSATDRLPVSLQEDLLSAWLGEDTASAWRNLMTKRDFSIKDDDKVRYSVGQPMGLLSSWAVFSLTHHAIVEYAAFKEGLPAFRDYYMLGDDVVIMNDRVANRYLNLMEEAGVDISIPKSYITRTNDENRIAEFAKQILWNGSNISPVPAKLLDETMKDIFMFPSFIKKLRELSRDLDPSTETRICSKLYGAIPKPVALVMTAPQEFSGLQPWDREILRPYFRTKSGENAPIEGFTFSSNHSNQEVVRQNWIKVRIEHLLKTQETQTMLFMKIVESENGFFNDINKSIAKGGIPISESVLKVESYNNLLLHPLVNKIQSIHWTFWSVEENLRNLLEGVSDLSEAQLELLEIPEFLPQISHRPYMGFKRQEAKTRSVLIRQLHRSLEEPS